MQDFSYETIILRKNFQTARIILLGELSNNTLLLDSLQLAEKFQNFTEELSDVCKTLRTTLIRVISYQF